MNELGPVSKHLESELREQARQHGIVFWLDPQGHYVSYADGLKQRADAGAFPFPTRCFRGSYLQLMRELDGLADGVGPRPMLVHVPGVSEEELRRTPLLELYRAGERKSFELPKLVQDAAYGRCTARELEAFLSGDALTLDAADAWLKRVEVGAAGAAHEGQDFSALSADALLDALLPGGTLHESLAKAGTEASVWKRAEVLLGLSADARQTFRDSRAPSAKGQSSTKGTASDLVLELVSWALAVEFIHDLKRPPHAVRLRPLAELPAPMVECCRALAKHLRTRHAEHYPRWADEVELRLEEELAAASAEELGQVDTFRVEDQKVLAAALEALARDDFAVAHRWALERGAGKSFWTQHDRVRFLGWQLVELAAALGCELKANDALLRGASSHAEALQRYAETGQRVDAAQRRLEQAREQASLLELDEYPELRACLNHMRKLYRDWADQQARAFNALCREQGFLPPDSLQQRNLFEDVVRPWTQESGTTVYFMVDALRYEMAVQLAESFNHGQAGTVALKPRLAELPSITAVGMNVLAPLVVAGKLQPELSEKGDILGFRGGQARIKLPEDRRKAIHERVGGKTCPKLTLEELLERDVTSLRKTIAEAKLLIVHSEGIDKAGEKGVGLMVFEQELRKLGAAWRLLQQAGVLRAVITADHGFLLHDATTRAPLRHGFKTDPERRHVVSFEHIVRPGEVAVSTLDLGYESEPRAWFLFPESAAPFDRGERAKDYVHGGNSLQERVIPVLTVQRKHAAGASVGSYRIVPAAREGVVLPTTRSRSLMLMVEAEGQTGLSFGGAKDVELVLECEDDPEVQVQLTDSLAATLQGNVAVVAVGQPFELFFRLTGPNDGRARVRVKHATGELSVEAFVSAERFDVENRVASAPAEEPKKSGKAAPAKEQGRATDAWLCELPEGGVRDVFKHLNDHGSVNEAEATRMLGGARQFRSFSRRFEEYARIAPFAVLVQTASGTKCYVRGER